MADTTPARAHRPQRIAAVAGTAFALMAAGIPGCGAEDGGYSAPCGVIVDGSGSGKKFDAGKRTADLLPDFLREHKCKRLTYVPLATDSIGSTCSQKDLDLDPDLGAGTDQDTIRAGRRAKAVKDAKAVFDCLAPKKPMSDVMGSLARAADQRPDGTGTYYVLVVSDMLQNDPAFALTHADLSSNASRAAVLNGPLKDRVPDLSGMELEITDCARTLGDPRKSAQVRAFWRQAFAAGASGRPKVTYD